MVRPEVELIVSAKEIPSELYVDLSEFELGDTINISNNIFLVKIIFL